MSYKTKESKLKLGQLRKLIAEEVKRSLLEVGEKDKKEEGEDSLDSQIDKYLIDYEVESKPIKTENKDFRTMIRRFLSEAEEDDAEPDDAEEDDSKEDDAKEESKKLTAEDLDVNSFIDNVVRLIENYDSLLEVQSTILCRATNFLLKGYEPDVAKAFKEIASERYDLQIGKSKYEIEDDEYEQPIADRAGSGLSS